MRPISLMLCLTLAACGTNTGGTREPPKPQDSGPFGAIPEGLRAAIIRDAATRAGIGIEEVRVLKVQRSTWNDGSLGCPKPGEFYTQALVAGWWVVVDAGGTNFDYRAIDAGRFKICEPGANPGGDATSSAATS